MRKMCQFCRSFRDLTQMVEAEPGRWVCNEASTELCNKTHTAKVMLGAIDTLCQPTGILLTKNQRDSLLL